jgi:hypothetical protein
MSPFLSLRAGGDATSDGMVDGGDLTVWRSGVDVPAAIAATASQMLVPEPIDVRLVILGGAILGLRRFFCGRRVAHRRTALAYSRRRGSIYDK